MMACAKVEPGYHLAELLDGMAEVTQGDDVLVTGLSDHAQTVMPGDLFLAIGGHRTHGLRYLNQALARGAAAVAWEPASDTTPPAAGSRVPIIDPASFLATLFVLTASIRNAAAQLGWPRQSRSDVAMLFIKVK